MAEWSPIPTLETGEPEGIDGLPIGLNAEEVDIVVEFSDWPVREFAER